MSIIKRLLNLIGDVIDEESFIEIPSFIEMAEQTIHVYAFGKDRYFRVSLEEVDGSEYFKPYLEDADQQEEEL